MPLHGLVRMRLSKFLVLVRVCQIICLQPTAGAGITPSMVAGKGLASGHVQFMSIDMVP